MAHRHKGDSAGCETDMTPMIDVVFQLIIFFIVTMKMDKEINPNIQLAMAKNGPIIEDQIPTTMVIEIDKRGNISIHNAQLTRAKLKNIMIARKRRLGMFPVLIRADRRTRHEDVRAVMDICTEIGIWRINFAAIQEKKTD